jgi:hypothetical protein
VLCDLCGAVQVVVSPETVESIERAKTEGRPLWRVSSTCFYHVASDAVLAPVGRFAESPQAELYPAIEAGAQVRAELQMIKLGQRARDAPRPAEE